MIRSSRAYLLPVFALALIVFPSWTPSFSQSQPTEEPKMDASLGYPVSAYMRCTREPAILDALRLMDQTAPSRSSLRWIVDQPVRIVFRDMLTLPKGFQNYDALSWISGEGEQVILVNEKHRTAPP